VSNEKRPADWRGQIDHNYNQPGILSALPYNKVAQFLLGLVVLIVVWQAFRTGWFSAFAFQQIEGTGPPTEGVGTPMGLLPFLIDAVCLIGLGGFAIFAAVRGLVGPLFAGVPEWIQETATKLRGEQAASDSAIVTGIKTTTGRYLSLKEINTHLLERIKRLEAKTADIQPPPDPAPPKSTEQVMLEKMESMQAAEQVMLEKMESMQAKIGAMEVSKVEPAPIPTPGVAT